MAEELYECSFEPKNGAETQIPDDGVECVTLPSQSSLDLVIKLPKGNDYQDYLQKLKKLPIKTRAIRLYLQVSKTDDPMRKCVYTLPTNADDPQIVETHYKATISLMSQFVKYYRQVYKCLSNIRRTKNKKSYLIQIICITSKVLDKRCDADFKQFADALKWYNTLSDTTDTKISDTMGKLKSKVDEFKSSMFEIKVMMKYEQEESIYELSVLEGEN